MTSWIAQCICPEQHNIGPASTSETDRDQDGQLAVRHLRSVVAAQISDGTIEPYCLTCRAPADEWRYQATAFNWPEG
jgi:hypothetical protein